MLWVVLASATVGEVAQGLVNELLTYRASSQLAKNMQCKTDAYHQERPDDGCWRPHHIVAFADRRAQQARTILAEVGIDINSAANGVWVECERHQRMHTDIYYEAVNKILGGASKNTTKVSEALREIARQIQNNTFPK